MYKFVLLNNLSFFLETSAEKEAKVVKRKESNGASTSLGQPFHPNSTTTTTTIHTALVIDHTTKEATNDDKKHER